MTDFATPSTAEGIDLKVLNGALLLITVNGQEQNIQTTYGPASPVRADIVVLDGPAKGETFADALIFPRVLISQLKSHVGGAKVLGRLGQGVAKGNQSPPWKLAEATDEDKATATRYLTYLASQVPVAAPTAPPQQW